VTHLRLPQGLARAIVRLRLEKGATPLDSA